jgi:GH24 family phage-related lysozyme (muramidase)
MDWKQVIDDLSQWEGRFPYMYLDTVDRVTVGVGNMLDDVEAAQELPFEVRATGKAANAVEKATDYNNVKKQNAGMLAQHYKRFTALDLPDQEIDRLLQERLTTFEDQLKKNFAGYETYPEPAQRALIDMIYNLGLGGLLKFTKLKMAVEKHDWKVAATECKRHGISDDRNNWTQKLFEEASKQS